MKKAYRKSTHYSEDFSSLADCEYLFTVCIADEVAEEYSPMHGTNHRIKLEENFNEFSKSCLNNTAYLSDSQLHKEIVELKKCITKHRTKERIDIAIYNTSGIDSALCAIEVKKLNPSAELILSDLLRNLSLFLFHTSKFKSTTEITYFAASHYDPKIKSRNAIPAFTRKVRELYSKVIKSLPYSDFTKIELHIKEIQSYFPGDDPYFSIDDDPDTDPHYFLGVTVAIKV